MRKVELAYVEILNETEQLFIFTTIFNKETYAQTIVMNMALPLHIQDIRFVEVISVLAEMTKKDADIATRVKNEVSADSIYVTDERL